MANYYATARSNYFKVKDEAAFRAALAAITEEIEITAGEEGRLALLADTLDGYGWPSWIYPHPEDDEGEEFDVAGFVAPHLADGEVAIFMEAGAEKLRYVSGHARAINNRGETREISLSDIYDLAKELGPNVTEATY